MPEGIEAARWIVAGLFAIILIIASISDIRYRRIGNFHAAGIAVDSFGIWGAGDSKLIAALALFVGWGRKQPAIG